MTDLEEVVGLALEKGLRFRDVDSTWELVSVTEVVESINRNAGVVELVTPRALSGLSTDITVTIQFPF